MHLATVLELAALRYPEMEALVDGQRRFTYGQWERRANAVAGGLLQAGLPPGGSLGICARNSEATATAFFAAQKAGAAAVLINARWKGMEIARALDKAAVRAVLFDEATADSVEEALTLGSRDVVRIYAPSSGMGRGKRRSGALQFEDLASRSAVSAPVVARRKSDTSTILFTSGTTGEPKGVPRTHWSDYIAALTMIVEHRWNPFERTLAVMPFYHTMGLHTLISMVILNGLCVLLPGMDTHYCLHSIERERLTGLFLVPTAFYDLARELKQCKRDSDRYLKLAFAGASMPVSQVEECIEVFDPAVFINHYGCTEMHVITVNPDPWNLPASAGRPALHSRVRIVPVGCGNQADSPPLSPGETGEVIVDCDSPQAFKGYLNQPDATEKAIRGGWYYSGDLGCMDDEGNLYLKGRVDDMIISGGENIYPLEVEEVLLRHPGVEDAAVVGLPHKRWGEIVTAFIVPAGAAPLDEDLERHFLDSELSRFKRPRRYITLSEIPRLPSGKVLRAQLKNEYINMEG